jgi:hypothetical protein
MASRKTRSKVYRAIRRIRDIQGEANTFLQSRYWNAVFESMFGQAPKGNDDPRWDYLLIALGGLRMDASMRGMPYTTYNGPQVAG